MLQVARLSPKLLRDAHGLVGEFTLSQINGDGGFKNRHGESDLYYTIFGIESLLALQAEIPSDRIIKYLQTFGDGESLDFIHLCCLARSWANLSRSKLESKIYQTILNRIEKYRSGDGGASTGGSPWHPAEAGGYHHAVQKSKAGTVYGSFLALGAYQDLGSRPSNPEGLINSLHLLKTKDGAYANEPGLAMGTTPATAAAVTLLRNLQQPIDPQLGDWLLARCKPEGGFVATPMIQVPDLLSTATALHALAGMQVSLEKLAEPCLDFVDTLWTNKGCFYGHWADDILDCEYTYYGLLALGHLSLY